MTPSRYTVFEALGQGGRVFRGVAEAPAGARRDVAISRVLPALESERFVPTFLADVRPALRMEHPSIVEMLDLAVTAEGSYFAVHDYVAGCDLSSLLAQRERLAPGHAIEVAVACCEALAYAHERGALHGSVCPRNVLLSPTGAAKLTGFGLAKASAQRQTDDVPGGHFSYLSPEAATGEQVDHSTDVFAVASMLWEMLAGRPLFLGASDYHTVMLVREAAFVPIPGLGAELDAILRKALARDPSSRYAGAPAVAEALSPHAAVAGLSRPAIDDAIVSRRAPSIDPQVLARVQAEVRHMQSVANAHSPP